MQTGDAKLGSVCTEAYPATQGRINLPEVCCPMQHSWLRWLASMKKGIRDLCSLHRHLGTLDYLSWLKTVPGSEKKVEKKSEKKSENPTVPEKKKHYLHFSLLSFGLQRRDIHVISSGFAELHSPGSEYLTEDTVNSGCDCQLQSTWMYFT